MENYGKTIAKLRKENGLTQSELGKELNVTYQAVSKWENDLSQPDLETIVAMCKLFGVTLDEFTGLAQGKEINRENAASYSSAQTESPAPAPVYDINNNSAPAVASGRNYAAYDEDKNHGFRIGYFLGLLAAVAMFVITLVVGLQEPDTEWYIALFAAYMFFSYIALIGHECAVWSVFFWGLTRITSMPGVIFSLDLDGILFLLLYKFIIAPILTLILWIGCALIGFVISFIMAPFVFPFKIPIIIKDTF